MFAFIVIEGARCNAHCFRNGGITFPLQKHLIPFGGIPSCFCHILFLSCYFHRAAFTCRAGSPAIGDKNVITGTGTAAVINAVSTKAGIRFHPGLSPPV